jgi:putative two-component system response regulator
MNEYTTKKRDILIVDDDPISLKLLEKCFEADGYRVQKADNGLDAWEKIIEQNFNLVIADWEMPFMNGIELCKNIRRGNSPGYTYVILLTGRNANEDITVGLDAGADDFISKPCDREELKMRVRAGEKIISRDSQSHAMFAMAKLGEARSGETDEHLERVKIFCKILILNLPGVLKYKYDVDEEYVRLIELASPLHDIGKIGIPDTILKKTEHLTQQEIEIMKTHTIIGYNSVDYAREFNS